jgi:hypothetical protein
MADVPTQSQVSAFLTDLGTLRRQLTLPSDAPVVPTTLDNLTYTVANEIEYLLWMVNAALIELENDLYEKIDRAAESFVYADEVSCGE